MARPIVMPVMGMYTEEGVLTGWLRAAGERVEAGDAVAEISTEKTAFEIPAPAAGILHPVAEVGTNLHVEGLMGYILAENELPPPAAAEELPGFPTHPPSTLDRPGSTEPPWPVASPAARRLASQHNIDLATITGTGPGGRIVEGDIAGRIAAPFSAVKILRRTPMAESRRPIAELVRATLSTAASTTLMREVDAGSLIAARNHLTESMGERPSYSSIFIKLLAGALREFPEWNSTVENDSLVLFGEVNIGFAVATRRGLVVPVVRHADSAPLGEIVREVRELSERAIVGRLRSAELMGATATISNLGAHHIDGFTPILNGPQAVILGIGRIAERPVVREGRLVAGHTCVLSLTFDHRIGDGVPAARLLDLVVFRMDSLAREMRLAEVPGKGDHSESNQHS
jgi:pyruvate dehydrogenase E2 component (dihydrolipoamide acetyltransferase)